VPARALASALSRYQAARRQLERAARSMVPDSADSAVHALRLKLKRVRYMRELLAPPGAYGTRTVQSLANWQRSLGAIADQRTMLRLIDRRAAWPGAHAAALAALRNRLLRAERRRIAALAARHGRRQHGGG
jgi:CHAD domain-containing protein